jgi:hypothetical protein
MKEYLYRSKDDRIQRIRDRRALMWRLEEEEEEQRKLRKKSDLEISPSNDPHELHADAVAQKVVNGEDASNLVKNQPSFSNSVQSKSENDTPVVTGQLETSLNNSKGGGQNLDADTMEEMGSRMGADLSEVKIHTGSNAHEMSESINAKAFTHGNDIYFKQGNFNTTTAEGKSLLAHELTHTQQQQNGLNRKIQRKEYRPKKVADDYFAGVSGYSFTDLQKYLGSDGSGPQNMKLQDLLSAIIYMNKDKTAQQVWDQIVLDPAQLKGYNAFLMMSTGDTKLPAYSRTAGTVTPVAETPVDITPQANATVDYSMSKNFLVSKKKREAKRKAASDLATGFIQGSAGKLQSVLDESQKDKEELQQKVQALLADVNNKLNTEGTTKAQTVTEKIAQIKVSAEAAKKEIIRYYYGSLTVINHNTKVQQEKLDGYAADAQAKITQLQSDQQAGIDTLFTDFKTRVNTLLPGFTQTVRDEGRKRYESHTTGMFTSSLDEAKGKSAGRASLQVESELNNLAVNTVDQAMGNAPAQEGDPETKKDYEASLKMTASEFSIEISSTQASTHGNLNSKAELDKQAAAIYKDDFLNRIDEITLGTIQSLTEALTLHYTQLDEFGAKQDAAINQLYSGSVLKLSSGSETQIRQVQQQLDSFAAGQKDKKTPKLKKLQENISQTEAQISPLIAQASDATKKQHAANLLAMDELSTLVFTEFDALAQKNTNAIDALVLNAETKYTETQKSGVDTQLQLRVDHLNAILSDVDNAKDMMQAQIDGFYDINQLQLEEIRESLAQRISDFETKANEIIASLGGKMDEAEKQTERDFYSGQLARNQNVSDFRGLSMKLYGTGDSFADLKKIMDACGYSSYEEFYNSLGSGLLFRFFPAQKDPVAALDKKVKVQGFAGGTVEYVKTIVDFEKAFRFAASALALQYVKDYQAMATKTQSDLRDPKIRKDLFEALKPYRNSIQGLDQSVNAITNAQRSTRPHGTKQEAYTGATPDLRDERSENQETEYNKNVSNAFAYQTQARNDLRALYDRYPILNDESLEMDDRLDKAALGHAQDPDALAAIIQGYITKRLSKANESIATITEDEGTEDVYNMNKAIPSFLQAFSLSLETFPGSIIQDKLDERRRSSIIWAIITVICIIVLTIISGPIGASMGVSLLTATLADVAIAAISITQAIEALEKFDEANSLAGMGLASSSSFLWVVLAFVGAGLSIAPLLKTASAAIKLNTAVLKLDAIGVSELPAFKTVITTMMESGQLTKQMGNIILTKVNSRMGYLAAVDEFNAASKVMVAGNTGTLLGPLTKMAFFKFKEGMSTFEEWLAVIKNANKAQTIAPEALVVYKQAYTAGMEGLETAAPQLANKTLQITAAVVDDIFATQQSVFTRNLNIIASATNNAKGVWGEIGTDVNWVELGYQALHIRKTALTQGWGQTGIDHVFRKGNHFYIVESKYGSAVQKMTDDGLQMSDPWIRGSFRLRDAVGSAMADEIIDVGYTRVLSKIAPDGTIVYKELNQFGIEIGDFFP